MRYLLDTNVISELAARQPSSLVVRWIDDLESDSVYLSSITIGELSKGIERLPASPRKDKLGAWLKDELLVRFSGRIFSLDADVMLTWGALAASLERAGRQMPAIDSLIAALALHHRCILVTRNESDFAHTPVQVINPWK